MGKLHRHHTKQVRQDYTGRKWHRNRLFQQSNVCGICNKPITKMKEATIDHIIPLSKGGSDDITNMQLAHYDCNQAKGDSLEPGTVVTPDGIVVYG
jgi:5-methylcytosine-specific restriction endonuclease McrA